MSGPPSQREQRETTRGRIARAPTFRLGAQPIPAPPGAETITTKQTPKGATASTENATASTKTRATDAAPPTRGKTARPTSTGGKETIILPAAPRELVPVPPPGTSASSVMVPRTQNSQPVFIKGTRRAPNSPVYRVVPKRQGPRGFTTQFLLALAVTVALCSVITLATPLNASLGISTNVQVYANGVPWVPTPTFTPKPTPVAQAYAYPAAGSNPGSQAIIAEITTVFGSYAQGALNIARCESGYNPNAWNSYPIGGSHASGVFQILYPSTWSSTSYSGYSPFNADANIHAAYQIFSRDGYTWREWECKPY